MNLKVLLPTEVLIDEPAIKIIAEAENGSFCLLPQHTDFVAALPPGILTFITDKNVEQFVGVAEGVLVKFGMDVRVSTLNAVRGESLGTLKQTITERFLVLDDRERVARSAIAKIEADFFRRFLELEELRHV